MSVPKVQPTIRVVVVSPDETIRVVRRALVAEAGLEVETCRPDECRQLLADRHFDALVLCRMQEAEAQSVIALFRLHNPRSRVISVRDGADPLVDANIDPYDPGALIRILRKMKSACE